MPRLTRPPDDATLNKEKWIWEIWPITEGASRSQGLFCLGACFATRCRGQGTVYDTHPDLAHNRNPLALPYTSPAFRSCKFGLYQCAMAIDRILSLVCVGRFGRDALMVYQASGVLATRVGHNRPCQRRLLIPPSLFVQKLNLHQLPSLQSPFLISQSNLLLFLISTLTRTRNVPDILAGAALHLSRILLTSRISRVAGSQPIITFALVHRRSVHHTRWSAGIIPPPIPISFLALHTPFLRRRNRCEASVSH